MHVEPRNLMWTLMPLFLAGALCSQWKVVYQQQHICAVRGSSVVILCSFYYADELRGKRFMWGIVKSNLLSGRFISGRNLGKFSSRFQYIGDKRHNCSLKIHQVEHNDAGKYAFTFITNSKEGKWPGPSGSTLKVVDLNILVTKPDGNRRTKEGDSVNLTCINSCDGGNLSSAFTWFKNGELINEGPVLYLSNMSTATSGSYTCSLEAHTGTASGVVNIDVEYGPKNTSVSARPLTEVCAGSNITLVCSSRANPPVKIYTWFKRNNDDIMDVKHQPVFLPGTGGQYFCSATNKHGSQNSSVVTVTIKPCWITFTRDALIIAAFALLLIGTTVIAIKRLHKKRRWAPNTDFEEEDTQDADYVNWLNYDSQSQEGNQREGETTEVVYTAVYFNKKRKSNMEQQMDDHNDVIYITVCRNQPPNPSYVEPP
ncbi:B-cell receptor CD22-like [Epinephelus lanceolatus]|uniref:B-cell receptor CD22-like n=1 Tax=Epinephelus lanceolatus TaxID=310571 RepID=UPI001444C7BC|nr:B-cell receptor CD22-like [Epinephelus lanceolatus]